MNPEKALQICPDFLLVRDPATGKAKCKHKEGDLCMHPVHFLCELVTYKNRIERKNERGDLPALSVSRIKSMEDCARKYALVYEHHAFMEADGEAEWKVVGSAFSVGRAKLDTGMPRGDLELKGRHAHALAKVKASLDYYEAHPPYPVGTVLCEWEVYLARDQWWFHGFLDALTTDKKTIREWKYAASRFEILDVIRQAAVYFLGVPEATLFERWKFPKPSHRPATDETPEAFYERVRKELFKKKPEEIYDVLPIKRSDVPVKTIIRQMIARMKTLPVLQEKGSPPSYGMGCGMCDYRPVCATNLSRTTEEIAAGIKAAKELAATSEKNTNELLEGT